MPKSPILWFFVGVLCTLLTFSESNLSRGATPQGFDPHGEPTIPGLRAELQDLTLSEPQLALDGINCIRCKLQAPKITYAGGAFRCEGCQVETKNVQFKGAALNTVAFLQSLGALQGSKRLPQAPKDPILRASFPIPAADSVTWVSPDARSR